MTPIRILAPVLLTFSIVSCSVDKPNKYDTGNPNGNPDAGAVNPAANPVYDTPAAYEASGTTPTGTPATAPITPYDPTPSVTTPTTRPIAAPTAAPTAPSNGAAIIHTVVAGDTLSGISSKYLVPSAAIRQANRMTNDTVVLGRKMVIPPVR